MIVAWLVGCDTTTPATGTLVVTPSEAVHTVATFAWETDVEADTRVEIADEEGPLLATTWRGAGDRGATLMGLPADSALTATVVTETGEVLAEGAFETEALPPELPDFTVTGAPEREGWLFTSLVGVVEAAVLLDPQGRIGWYRIEPLDGHIPRVRLEASGTQIDYLYDIEDADPRAGKLFGVSIDGETVTVLDDEGGGNHDFELLPDGTVGMISLTDSGNPDPFEGGTALLEIAPDGTRRTVFDSNLVFEPTPKGYGVSTHGNALHYQAETDRWWLSLRNLDTIVQIDRASGEVVGMVGGALATYAAGEGTQTGSQHGFQFVEGGFVVHDNRDSAAEYSRVAQLALDESTHSVSLVREWYSEPPAWAWALGEPVLLDGGGLLVTWGSVGVIEEFDESGASRARLEAPLGTGFGYLEPHETLPGQVALR